LHCPAEVRLDQGMGRLCDTAEHTGFDKTLAGFTDAGDAGGLKACRGGTRHVHRVVVEEQHPPGWHLEQVRDLREGRYIRLEQA